MATDNAYCFYTDSRDFARIKILSINQKKYRQAVMIFDFTNSF